MKTEEKHMKEIVRQMEIIEAPDGFTERVMNRVLAGPKPAVISYKPLISPVVWLVILAIFIALLVMVYFSSGAPSGTGSFYGINLTIEPALAWLREVFESVRTINTSPVLIYLSVFVLLMLLLIDELILKRIWHRL
jgi:uncharacterized protein YggT (Ycf19 family)